MYKYKFLTCLLVSTCICFSIITSSFCTSDTSYVWSPMQQTSPTSSLLKAEEDIKDDNFLNLESGAAILVEQTTGKILYSHNIHEQLRPASVTKIMSILLIMKQLESGKLQLTDQIPCSEKAASMGGSQIWLDPTETLTVDEMLKAICVRKCKRLCICYGRIHCRN